ncbi:MAG: histidinol-phosphate transaminase [Woeseiaceae bacterium]|nr:histidinol-phosphate transaminase [Woeseiaceae bacterium]
MNTASLARPEIASLSPYAAAAQDRLTVRLNANEIPWSPSAEPDECLNRYPLVRPWALRDRLAEIHRVSAQQLLVTRGTSEAIDLLVRVFCRAGQDNIVITPPTFGMYKVYADIQGAGLCESPLRAEQDFRFDIAELLRVPDERSKLIIICSPNNPTGNSMQLADLETLIAARQGRSLIVIDEAYIEFSTGRSAITLMERYENLAVLRTLSKAHGLAAARLGCVLAQPAVIRLLDSIMAPYSIATAIANRAMTALRDENLAVAADRIAQLVAERQRLQTRLSASVSVEKVWASDANFLLVRFRNLPLTRSLLEDRRILIRDVSAVPGLQNCARITVGTRSENDLLLDTINGKSTNHA